MEEQLPIIIIAVPLFAALLVTALWWVDKRVCFPITIIAGLASLIASIGLLLQVLSGGAVDYRLGGWPPPFGIAYRIDHLNSLIIVAVSLVSLLNLAGSRTIVQKEFQDKLGAFYALYLLFTTGLLGILITGDAFNLYVLLEIASLTGYALIGLGQRRAPLSGLNYLFMGTIGASLYLLGVGYLYVITGTLNMVDMARILPSTLPSNVVVLAFILCLSGLFVKMALFPLHGWLPNAYTYSPSVVSSLVAPLTTKVMIYAMFRVMLTIFSIDFSLNSVAIRLPIIWLAIAAIVMGSIMALAQKRLKKMLAFIVVAEVGYMVGGFWLGNRAGMSGAVLHVINDAVMTLCVFMAAGAIVYKTEDDRLSSLKGVFRKMPVSMAAMVVGGLSLIGVPPTCGFFSKWYLISGGMSAGQYGFVAALLFSSLVNTVLFFRLFEIGYFEPFASDKHHRQHNHTDHSNRSDSIAEAPLDVLVPLLTTAVLLLVLGIYSGEIVTKVIDYVIPAVIG
ncbi:MAG: complex I subunit 5 family protein [Desulfocapsaceae bacterium]